MIRRSAPFLCALAIGCGSETAGDSTPPPASCAPPNRVLADGRCIAPGVQDDGCPAGTKRLDDGTCRPAGIPADGCGEGFAHDGDVGCIPILPSEGCPTGLIAVPGDAECRPVMPCGAGKWGDIAVDATTEHVDGSYAGADSDGSAAKPWLTIGDAFAAASDGGMIAIAAGSYAEDLAVSGKAVRIWGVCPEKVEIVGSTLAPAAVTVTHTAAGTELRGIAVTGASSGLALSGSEDVLFDRVWVHDCDGQGIHVEGSLGSTSFTLVGALVEDNADFGVFASHAVVTVDASAIRRTRGQGLAIQLSCNSTGCHPNTRSTATVTRSLIDDNRHIGLSVLGSDVTIDATVVRATSPEAGDPSRAGVELTLACDEDLCDPTTRTVATIRSSVVDQTTGAGVLVTSSDVTMERVVVRGSRAPLGERAGQGLMVQACVDPGCDASTRSIATVRQCLLDQNQEVGALVIGSDALVEDTVVRGTLPAEGGVFGRGASIQPPCIEGGCDGSRPSSATIARSVVDGHFDVGVLVLTSQVTLEATLVRNTQARVSDALFGDGVAVFASAGPATATLTNARIDGSARAGLSSFGGLASIGGTAIQCSAFDLEGEVFGGLPFAFEDRGGNGCGCPGTGACVAVSVGIAPPELPAPTQ